MKYLIVLLLAALVCAGGNTGVWHNNTNPGHPSAREGSSSVTFEVSGSEKNWVVFGGHSKGMYYNDVYSLNLADTEPTWKTLDAANSPSPRAFHTSVGMKSSVLVFGGDVKLSVTDNAVYELDLSKEPLKWVNRSATNPPSPRFAHTADVADGKMYVFGGYDGKNILNDVFVYHYESNSWLKLKTSSPPPGRYGHSSALYNNKLYIFGGFTGDKMTNPTNSTWCLDLSTNTWSAVDTKPSSVTGKFPEPRAFATTTLIENKTLWVFGGLQVQDSSWVDTNDVWILAMEGDAWSEAKNIRPNNAPKARHGGVAAVMPGTQAMNVFGGADAQSNTFSDAWYFIVLQ
jgi:N-acetylneuraminic acid mutarotase